MQLPNNQGLGGINEFYEFNIEPDGLASVLDLPKGVVEIGEHLLMDVLGTLKGQAPGAIYAVGSDYSFEYEDTPPAKSLVEFLRQCD